MDLDTLFTNTDYKTIQVTLPCHLEIGDCNVDARDATDENDTADDPNNGEGSAANAIVSPASSLPLQATAASDIPKPSQSDTEPTEPSQPHMLTVNLAVSQSASTDFDLTGQILWPVSNLLAYFVASKMGQHLLRNRNVVELGAGCGLPGLVASHFAKMMVLTDGNGIVTDLLQRNIDAASRHCEAWSQQFCWGDTAQMEELLRRIGTVDVILAADVVQWPAVVEPLLHTVKRLLWSSSTAKQPAMILGIVNRATTVFDMFFTMAKELGFATRKIEPIEFLKDGVVPECCQEFGDRSTQIFEVKLVDRSIKPVLLESTAENMIVGSDFQNTSFLPC